MSEKKARCPICGDLAVLKPWPLSKGTPAQIVAACQQCEAKARKALKGAAA